MRSTYLPPDVNVSFRSRRRQSLWMQQETVLSCSLPFLLLIVPSGVLGSETSFNYIYIRRRYDNDVARGQVVDPCIDDNP